MKIALFAPYDLAVHGGIATHIRAQARALRRLGHTVSVFGPASAPLTAADGRESALGRATTVTFGGTASGAALSPLVFGRVRRLFTRESYEVVHVHEPLMPLVPWAAACLANVPVVGTFHVYREAGHRWYAAARPMLQRIVNRLDARIAVSEAARETVARFFPGDYEIIPNGIELERFERGATRPSSLPANRSIVLCVGRLEPRKGVATLVDAMARVQARANDGVLVLVGDGPDYDALRAQTQRLGVRTVFARDVDDDALPAYYAAADIICAPAIGGESFGMVLIEALAAGKLVVASRIDGYVAAVGETPCVRWVVPGDADALSTALITALQNPHTWRADALQIASAYDWRSVAERLVDVYHRVQRPTEARRVSHT